MALVINNRVQETTTSTGTGTITLAGAVTQFQSFSAGIGDNNSTYYVIADQNGINWEIGQGTFTASNNTLTRSTSLVTASSNNNNLVNFTSGTKSVFSTYTAKTAVLAAPYSYSTNIPSLSLDFVNCNRLDPRITFSRSTSATYYDGKTTILAEQNLFLNNNNFANTSSWATSNGSINFGVLDPLGSSNAFSFTATSNNATLLQTVLVSSTNPSQTLSFYIQRISGTGNVNFYIAGSNYNNNLPNVKNQSITTDWARYSNTYTINTSAGGLSLQYGIQLEKAGDIVNIYSAQLENRSFLTPDIITTTSFISNYIPQLMTAPANVPRFDYEPSTGRPLGLLIEESRTNLITNSSANTGWTSVGTFNFSPNALIAPDGTVSANKFISGTANSIYKSISANSANTYTFSFYCKPKNENLPVQLYSDNLGTIGSVSVYPKTGTFVINSGSINKTATSVYVGNGWYRVSMTGVVGSSGFGVSISNGASAILTLPYGNISNNNQIQLTTTGTLPTGLLTNTTYYVVNSTGSTFNVALTQNGTPIDTSSDGSGTHSFIGISGQLTTAFHIKDNGNLYGFWGAQVELGEYPTSYISTTNSPITRTADNAYMTGNNFSSWYNQFAGTFFLNVDTLVTSSNNYFFVIAAGDDGTSGIILGNSNYSKFKINTSGTVQQAEISPNFTLIPTIKIAGSYTKDNFNAAFNGILGTPSTTGSLPLPTKLYLGYNQNIANGSMGVARVRKLAYYPVVLSPANLQALTSQ